MTAAWAAHPAIAGASDVALNRAIMEHMGVGQFAPKLADIVALLKQGGGSRTPAANTGPSCLDCGGTGWREGSALRADGGIDGPWSLVCGCMGRRGVPWRAWLQIQEDRYQRGEVVQWWLTGHEMPRIPDEGRLTQDQLDYRDQRSQKGQVLQFQRRPEDPHAAQRARQEKELKREGWG